MKKRPAFWHCCGMVEAAVGTDERIEEFQMVLRGVMVGRHRTMRVYQYRLVGSAVVPRSSVLTFAFESQPLLTTEVWEGDTQGQRLLITYHYDHCQ